MEKNNSDSGTIDLSSYLAQSNYLDAQMKKKSKVTKHKRTLSKHMMSKLSLMEWLPKDRMVWLVFDMSNGDRGSKRYVWWFDTKKQAKDHIDWQRKQKWNAELSEPHKFQWMFE